MVTPLASLGNTMGGTANASAYLAGLAPTGDAAIFESYPGTPNGPGSGSMVAATGSQFICASQNGNGTTTGASSTVKYTSDLASGSSLVGNIQLSKTFTGSATGGGFVTFNLPKLSQFSFEFYRAGSNGYQLDYSTNGTTWTNIVTTSPSRAACTGNVCDETNLIPTPITQPLILRLQNINTGGTMVIQGLMIKP